MSFDKHIIQLSLDHSPELNIERRRIESRSGQVVSKGKSETLRIYNMHGNGPGLAVSRSIGDSNAKVIGVISEPYINQIQNPNCEFFLIVASDGI